MFLNLFILSVILVAFLMLAIGMKALFDPKAEFSAPSCHLAEPGSEAQEACSHCEVKEILKPVN